VTKYTLAVHQVMEIHIFWLLNVVLSKPSLTPKATTLLSLIRR